MNYIKDKIAPYCLSVTEYSRRRSSVVRIGTVTIGGLAPVAVQSMTDTDTNDTAACVEQVGRIRGAGGRIVRLTAQGVREAENLGNIVAEVKRRWPDTALVADIHFLPQAAYIAAGYVDKVRINPGNYNGGVGHNNKPKGRGNDLGGGNDGGNNSDSAKIGGGHTIDGKNGDFRALLKKCASHGTALRIGVNHGSLSERIVAEYGDTPRGMVASAQEFLRECRAADFDRVVVSMKSSNTRVMVHAYRLLAAAMTSEGMDFPIHLGVTEAGNGVEGRIKSAVGIGALLADGIGDTIRVSLTEPPENEIPVALTLVEYFAERKGASSHNDSIIDVSEQNIGSAGILFDPYEYSRRRTDAVGRLGGGNIPLLYSELNEADVEAIEQDKIAILTADGLNPVGEWRRMIMKMDAEGDRRPVILHRRYAESSSENLMIKAAADFGVMFIDGLADGIYIENELPGEVQNSRNGNGSTGRTKGEPPIEKDEPLIDSIALAILQASRARISKTEYIACPGCGRTLFDLHGVLDEIKSRTSHLKGIKIAVMGCIVNGPGEMADADYGYVGASPGRVTLCRGRVPVRRNVPQDEAVEALIDLLKSDGVW